MSEWSGGKDIKVDTLVLIFGLFGMCEQLVIVVVIDTL